MLQQPFCLPNRDQVGHVLPCRAPKPSRVCIDHQSYRNKGSVDYDTYPLHDVDDKNFKYVRQRASHEFHRTHRQTGCLRGYASTSALNTALSSSSRSGGTYASLQSARSLLSLYEGSGIWTFIPCNCGRRFESCTINGTYGSFFWTVNGRTGVDPSLIPWTSRYRLKIRTVTPR